MFNFSHKIMINFAKYYHLIKTLLKYNHYSIAGNDFDHKNEIEYKNYQA